MAQYTKPKQIYNDEVSLLDIIRFFHLNWKFLSLLTLVLSSLAIAFSLSKPQSYQKQVTLSIEPLPLPVSSQSIPAMKVDQLGAWAVGFLQRQKLDQITLKPTYDLSTQQVDLTLQSSNPSALAEATPKVINQLNVQFQKKLSSYIQTGLSFTNQDLQKYQKILAQLEPQIQQLPVRNGANLEIRTETRLRALEAERAKVIGLIATRKVDQENLEQALNNPAQLAKQILAVQVLSESEVRQTRHSLQAVVIAVIASFMLAVLAAIVRTQIPRLKDELSKENVNKITDV